MHDVYEYEILKRIFENRFEGEGEGEGEGAAKWCVVDPHFRPFTPEI